MSLPIVKTDSMPSRATDLTVGSNAKPGFHSLSRKTGQTSRHRESAELAAVIHSDARRQAARSARSFSRAYTTFIPVMDRSATSRFKRPFSSRNCRNSRSSLTPSPAYCFFQA